jgi:hypothetical protein
VEADSGESLTPPLSPGDLRRQHNTDYGCYTSTTPAPIWMRSSSGVLLAGRRSNTWQLHKTILQIVVRVDAGRSSKTGHNKILFRAF